MALVSRAVDALRQVEGWPAETWRSRCSAAGGSCGSHGDREHVVPLGLGDEAGDRARVPRRRRGGHVDLDEPAGPPGSTFRHLLAHASGPAVRGRERRSRGPASGGSTRTRASRCSPSTSRERAEMPFADYLGAAVLGRSGSARSCEARRPPGSTARSTTCCASPRELLAPDARRAGDARRGDVACSSRASSACCPDFGRMEPNDWGLGFELRDAKSPHWTGTRNSPRTFGHFGGSGTFLWVDPEAELALACLTDLEFGPGRSRPGRGSRTPYSSSFKNRRAYSNRDVDPSLGWALPSVGPRSRRWPLPGRPRWPSPPRPHSPASPTPAIPRR